MEEEIKFTSLISMTDFVLERKEHWRINSISTNGNELSCRSKHSMECENYANFLRRRLTLNMFIPCDENDRPLKKLTEKDFQFDENHHSNKWNEYLKQYKKAEKDILFKGCDFDRPTRYRKTVEQVTCIENLMMFGFELTPTAIKKILVS